MQTIYLDISNKGVIPTIYAKRGDVGRKFLVVLTDSGIPYAPPAGSVFSAWYEGDSGDGNYTDIGEKSAFSANGNKVTVEMISQMLSNDGDGVLSLVLNDPNGNQISTWNIPYICEYVPGADSEEAKAYYTAFSQAVENLPYPDASLSVPGKAADAAATGKALEGKAPAGYGLGAIPSAVGDVSTTLTPGWFRTTSSTANINLAHGAGIVLAYNENEAIQILGKTTTGEIHFRTTSDGGATWTLGMIGAPGFAGTEYATMERRSGKVVYTRVIPFGALPNNSSKTVATNIPTTYIVRSEHIIYSSDGKVIQSPYFQADGTLMVKHLITGSGIQITATSDYSGYTAVFQIWYTKEDLQ